MREQIKKDNPEARPDLKMQEKWLLSFMMAATSLIYLYLIYFTWQRTIFQFDGIEYIYNGRALATGSHRFSVIAYARPPLIQFLYGVLWWIFSAFLTPGEIIKVISFFSLGITGLLLLVAFRFFRQFFSPLFSLFFLLLFLLNRLVLHYASEPMTDLLSTLFLLLAFEFYIKLLTSERTWKQAIASGIFLGLATATRHNLGLWAAILGFCFFARFYLLPPRGKSLPLRQILGYGALLTVFPFLIFSFFQISFFYFLEGHLDPWFLPKILYNLRDLQLQFNIDTDVPYEYILHLFSACGPVLLALSFFGLLLTFYRFSRKELEIVLGTFFFVAFLSTVHHKEGRYILAALPFIYYLAGKAFLYFLQIAPFQKEKVALFIGGICLLSSGYRSYQEILTLQDPLYRSPLIKEAAEYIKKRSPGKKVYFADHFYCLYPREYPRGYHTNRYDEFYHFYHITYYPLELLSQREIQLRKGGMIKVSYGVPSHPFLVDSLHLLAEKSLVIYGLPNSTYSGNANYVDYNYPLTLAEQNREFLAFSRGKYTSPHFEFQLHDKVKVVRGKFPFELYFRDKGDWRRLGLVVDIDSIYVFTPSGEQRVALSSVFPKKPVPLLAIFQKIRQFYR